MSTTLDLINAIQKGDSVAIEQHFEYAMTTRIAERLDDMRAYVAKSMFNEDVDVCDYEDVITEADIEAFMQTEEFEQLDELSKKTLGSYVTKAAHDMAISHANRMVKAGEADEVDRFMNRNTAAGYKEKHGVTDNMKKALGADSESVNKHMYRSAKRAKGIDTAVKKLTKEDVDNLLEAAHHYVRFTTKATTMDNNEKMVKAIHKSVRDDAELGDKISKNFGGGASGGHIAVKSKKHLEAVKAHVMNHPHFGALEESLVENKVPAGIKLFHHDKEGKESYSIHMSAQDAQREEKRRKKMGHKVVAHSLVYGQNDEGERVNH